MPVALFRRRIADYLDAVTEHWIGWTFPPVERAIEGADWKPDPPDAYCHRCGDSVGPGEASPSGCATCRQGAELSGGIAGGVLRLGPYTQSLGEWVRFIKFNRWSEMGEHLGRELGRCVGESKLVDLERAVIVPMPMPWQRRWCRGIDHARVIADGVGRELQAPVVSMLARDNRPPQVTLAPSWRRRSGSRGLRIRRRWGGWPLDGAHLVLVDDVRTTGATLKAAARLLKALKPQRVVCAVLAVSDSKARRDRAAQRADRTREPRMNTDGHG